MTSRFEEDVELTGFMKAHLWVEADGHDEMDLFLTVMKLDEKGEFLPTNVLGESHPGAWGGCGSRTGLLTWISPPTISRSSLTARKRN